LEQKTAPQDHADAGPMGHVERPQSESASNDLQFTRQRLIPAADRPRSWDRSRPLGGIYCWQNQPCSLLRPRHSKAVKARQAQRRPPKAVHPKTRENVAT
jgi:hypothetical protein